MKKALPLHKYLIRWERGHHDSAAAPTFAGHWRLRSILARLLPSESPVQYICGQEQMFFCLTAAGVAWACSESCTVISEPQERVFKLILSSDVLLISMQPGSRALRFSRLDLGSLCKGETRRREVFRQSSVSVAMLRQVDSSRMVLEDQGSIDVWDLKSELMLCSVAGKYGIDTWYSNNHLVQVKTDEGQSVLYVKNVESSQQDQVTVPMRYRPIQVQVIGRRLFVVSSTCPVQVFDLETKAVSVIGTTVPKFVLETESVTNALVCCEAGQAYLLSQPELVVELAVKNPIFADTPQVLAVLEEQTCTIISREGRVLDTFSVPQTVVAVGVNEDTLEVYAALTDGTILIYD